MGFIKTLNKCIRGFNMTDEIKKEYVENGGTYCPYCDSGELFASHADNEDGIITQDIKCMNCGKKWTDVFKLIRVVEQS